METDAHPAPVLIRGDAERQWIFLTGVVVLTGFATWVFADLLWAGGLDWLDRLLLVVFVPLFAFVAFGFLQALAGFFVLLAGRGRDPRSITQLLEHEPPDIAALPPTALVLPIYNEDVSRVYEGLRAIYLDLVRTGAIDRFDFFILSDSTDPSKWIEEEVAWLDLCKQVKGFGRIFYRKRAVPLNRKSGNVSDFLRRWGRSYRYMVILDADSLMSADTLVRLATLMERHPQAGIIQSVPVPVQGRTFFSRMMQFGSTLYGPLFQIGQNYWQGCSGNYWGHNAILRTAPFMEHCQLPPLQHGTRARFMSHDYVEAALMRRAGYEVWMACDLDGSFENLPPTLIDHAVRDRRWCRGNLQHGWLLTARELHPISRLHLAQGILAYWSSPLWLLFLALGTAQFAVHRWRVLRHRIEDPATASFLDPASQHLALLLFLIVMGMLTLPKLLALLRVLVSGRRRRAFGGFARLSLGVLLEHAISAVLAPIFMLFHTTFVFEVLTGRNIPWNTQSRDSEDGVDWRRIVRAHLAHTAVGILWALLALRIHPDFFWWLSPITFGLMASIPLSALLSWPAASATLRRLGLFRTPVEGAPPPVVSHVERNMESVRGRQIEPPALLQPHYGFLQVALDPYINAAHVSLQRQKRRLPHAVNRYLEELIERALTRGPAALSRREQAALLRHAEATAELHDRVWRTPESKLAPWWVLAMRHYNTLTAKPPGALYR